MPTALITGCNRGIGLELVRQLKAKSFEIIGVCREPSEELKQEGVSIISGVDMSDENSLKDSLAKVPASLDLVIQNAGIFNNDTLEDLSRDSLMMQFVVNSVAPIQYASLLVPKMRQGGKIALITSRMGSMQDNTSGAYYGYRMSKAALNAGAKSLSVDLKGQDIAVMMLHPGYVKTRMTSYNGDVTPEESAAGLIRQIEGMTMANTGTFYHANGENLPF